MRRLWSVLLTLWFTSESLLASAQSSADLPLVERVSFNRDIRPILSEHCFPCHGPDAATRQADLRLDDEQEFVGHVAELFRRITSNDEAERMPPVDSGLSLSQGQRERIATWIEQGAKYETHWSFTAPSRPAIPETARGDWSHNPIDRFVLAKLESERLAPSPEANKLTLLRRVTLDLTGLPPTIDEQDAFLADTSPGAYERVVDRLLASPRYGERMAADWLDAARYADTHGYLFDTERYMWRWRDWVIEAFNRNQPFDEFTIEQFAGDLLPEATPAQRIATGFHRNHVINNEAGADPAEYLVENVIDRVNTSATVWMGLTLGCAQCHDHKFDPISQREYYQLYAFFNNVPESGLDGFNANAKPVLAAPTDLQRRRQEDLYEQLRAAEEEFAPIAASLDPARKAWEAEFHLPAAEVADGLKTHLALDGNLHDGAAPERVVENKEGMQTHEPGMFGQAAALDGQRYLDLGQAGNFDRGHSFTLSAWIYPTNVAGRRAIFSKMEPPEASFRGYALQLVEGAPALFLVNAFPENMLQIQAKETLQPHRWRHILATYDGSGKASGAKLFVDGKLQEPNITIDTLTETFANEQPLQVGNGRPVAKFAGRIDEVRIYDRVLADEEIARLPGLSIQTLLGVTEDQRSDEVRERVRNYFLEQAAPPEWREPYARVTSLREETLTAARNQPTVMVMADAEQPRETRMLVRGAFDHPGEVVSADTPAFLPAIDPAAPKNRLTFARWLVDPSHPLTSRVAVNRLWQAFFGQGLVRTAEDFGRQGESPSHPELLDWLATEFSGESSPDWDVKSLVRTIVTSAAYRQLSVVSPELLSIDPENRLLARGVRHRLSAEAIRDQALAASGLLVERLGGPSVKPYQSADLWREVAFDVTGKILTAQIFEQDRGAGLYRRSLYTFVKRTSPPPTMLIFDGSDRERCVVRRETTNTPLQALVLMNDTTYIEASRKLAERMMTEGGSDPAVRLAWGFRLVVGRPPTETELKRLEEFLGEQSARFMNDFASAEGLLNVGDSPVLAALPHHELAAYALVASILFNLDESITKN